MLAIVLAPSHIWYHLGRKSFCLISTCLTCQNKNTAVAADVSQRENIIDSDIFVRKDNFPAERIMLITWKFTAVEYQPQDVWKQNQIF